MRFAMFFSFTRTPLFALLNEFSLCLVPPCVLSPSQIIAKLKANGTFPLWYVGGTPGSKVQGVKRPSPDSPNKTPPVKFVTPSPRKDMVAPPPWEDESQLAPPQKQEPSSKIYIVETFKLCTTRKDKNGKGISTLDSKEELKQLKCLYKPDYNGKPFPHWETSPRFTNIADKTILKHLSPSEFEMATYEILDQGHPDNLKMLAEFEIWAKDNVFIYPRK
jgi:hypothetical protein